MASELAPGADASGSWYPSRLFSALTATSSAEAPPEDDRARTLADPRQRLRRVERERRLIELPVLDQPPLRRVRLALQRCTVLSLYSDEVMLVLALLCALVLPLTPDRVLQLSLNLAGPLPPLATSTNINSLAWKTGGVWSLNTCNSNCFNTAEQQLFPASSSDVTLVQETKLVEREQVEAAQTRHRQAGWNTHLREAARGEGGPAA